MSPADRPDLRAWERFCQRMEALAERIQADDFPDAPSERVEGIAHLADQVSCWLGWALAHADTTAPFFHRSNDLFTQWGGPNQDNVYRHARIDPARRYRIRGRMHSCEHFALTLRIGFMHMKEWGTRHAISSFDLGVGPGDDFEILLGGDGSQPGWTPIPPEVTTVSLREYYVDWKPEEPAVFTIECMDPVAPPPARDAGEVARQIDHALEQTERSVLGWNEYLRSHRARGGDNRFEMHGAVAGVLADARYGFLFWDLEPEQLLLVDTDVPRARYWGLQLATLGWFEPVDPVHRVTSINHRQAHVSSDGRVRFVVGGVDPGVANWLDTGGRRNGLLTYRWFWAQDDPSPSTRVLSAAEVPAALPPDTPQVDERSRRAELAARRAHLAWRFRT